MRKQILVFDYDRTLTIDAKGIPESTKEILRDVREKDLAILGIVSGRLLSFLRSVNEELKLPFSFLVAENGAVISDERSGSSEVIGRDWAEKAKEIFSSSGLPVRFGEVMGASRVENAERIVEFLEKNDLKASIVQNIDSILLLPPGVGKGTGVLKAISKYGSREEIELTSFGDGQNDVSLFEPADNRVAVSNAVPELKQIATTVTKEPGGLGVEEYIRNKFMQ